MHGGSIILILVVAIVVWIYSDITVVIGLAILGLIIALICFIYVLLRSEGHIKKLTNFFRKIGKKYKKFETKLFKWWDEL